MQVEISKIPESVEGVQPPEGEKISFYGPRELPLPPKRKRRVLVINEMIEIELKEESDDELDEPKSPKPLADVKKGENVFETNPIYTYIDTNQCNADLRSAEDVICTFNLPDKPHAEEKTGNNVKIEKELNCQINNFIIDDYEIRNHYRKIAPKECPIVVDDEKWRVNHPKKKEKPRKRRGGRNISKLIRSWNIKIMTANEAIKLGNCQGNLENLDNVLTSSAQTPMDSVKTDSQLNECNMTVMKINTNNAERANSVNCETASSNLENSLSLEQTNSVNCEITASNFENSLSMEVSEEILPIPCEETFEEIKVESQGDMQLIQCPYCNYKFTKEGVLKRHVVLTHIENIGCPYCNFRSSSGKTLKLHSKKHDGNEHVGNLIKCPMCDITSKNINFIRKHVMMKHNKDAFLKCVLCGFQIEKGSTVLDQIHSLKDHVLNIHSGNGKSEYCCPVCDFRTTMNLEMKSHIYLVHSNLKGGFFQCLECTFIADSKTKLLHHFSLHKTRETLFCDQCKFSGFNEQWMNLHKKTHAKKLFKCPYCHFKSKEHFLLKYHMICKQHNKTI